ncbi:hypothetical protein GGX14DRAFT_356876 [Mycena pura]|uniref:F-box domain-containing protein n=1 Tax=Mycena pura TaxID=153505 RepID=A0AAD6YFL1_9AGAR|nr:hypothetical protein GGX14DRAFT_356876 [Mycena pura]
MSLAPETLEEIIAFTPPESHLALSVVSKLLYALCVRPIYSDVSLKSAAAVAKCCRTLANNAFAASAVRSFEISYAPSFLRPFGRFYSLIGRALQQMTNVQRLDLLAPDYQYIAALAHCSLPRLSRFTCCLFLDDTMVAFLNRHLQISYLQLGAHEDTPLPHDAIVMLPKLEYFVGNTVCVAPLMHHASLRAAFITWDDVGQSTEDPITALERSSTDTLNFLGCRRQGWNIDLLDRISTHLPHIYALNLTNLFFTDDPPEHSNRQTIGMYLSRFSCLQRLAINCNVWRTEGQRALQLDDAFDTVTAWGNACPSLVECTPPQTSTLKWVRVCDDLWLPDPANRTGTRWIWGRLRAGSYAGWDRVVAAVRKRRRGADAQARLLALRTAALAHEYETDDEDAVGVRGVRLGGAGWRVADDEDE